MLFAFLSGAAFVSPQVMRFFSVSLISIICEISSGRYVFDFLTVFTGSHIMIWSERLTEHFPKRILLLRNILSEASLYLQEHVGFRKAWLL